MDSKLSSTSLGQSIGLKNIPTSLIQNEQKNPEKKTTKRSEKTSENFYTVAPMPPAARPMDVFPTQNRPASVNAGKLYDGS